MHIICDMIKVKCIFLPIYFFSFQEAFKAVEDIHGLFSLSKKPPKPQLMANYYNKVSTVFWKSGNALFHACTLHRLYHLSREMRKNLTQDEMQRYLQKTA